MKQVGFVVSVMSSRPTMASAKDSHKRVLVTGATGFVGSSLCSTLLQHGYKVHVLRRSMRGAEELDALNVVSHIGDVTDLDSVRAALSDGEGEWKAVFHGAGVVAYSSKMSDLMHSVNVDGTRNVITAIQENPSKPRLVHVSSIVSVGYNNSENQPPLNEDSPWDEAKAGKVSYLRTKHAGERLVMQTVAQRTLDAVVVCPSNVVGASDAKKGSRKNQIQAAQGALKFYTHGGINIIGIRQCCDAMVKAMEVGRLGHRYILGGENMLIHDMLSEYSRAAGTSPPSICLPNWVVFLACFIGEVLLDSKSMTLERAEVITKYHYFDSSKAVRELGLDTSGARDAIRESVNWMIEHNYVHARKLKES
ncbi:hypothetical protein NDN08_002690 [Rhodosorus marinus]|uniref:Ketoreductase domain-containing protein n=1 Tax=Rhodosorus marinus TaxID=101924 RepID=A0AAV8UUF3_9RHOD|nr:hypothetical protein NDN08_002690 [Rhodosorus marinus]